MGATNICTAGTGTDYREVYRALQEEATLEYGCDAYNGTVSTMRLVGMPRKVAETYSKAAEKRALKLIEDDDWGVKWEARCLDLGVVKWEVCRYAKKPAKATAVWQTFYVAYEGDRELGAYKTCAEARERMEKAMASADGSAWRYCVRKVPRMVDPSTDELAVLYERTRTYQKTKPKRVPKGATVRAVHRYWYYGWASV